MQPRNKGVIIKPKHFGPSLKKLVKALKYYRLPIIATIILAVLGTALTIAGPKIMGNMINIIVEDLVTRMTVNPAAPFRYDVLGGLALLLAAMYIVSAIFSYISGWIISGVTQKVVRRFRRDISHKINKLPISYFDKHQYGDTLSRVTNDIDTIAQSLNQSITQLISSATLLVGILIMMLSISWQMSLIAIAVLPLSMLFIAFVTKNSQKYFKQQQNELGNLNGHIEEIYAGQTIVKVFSATDRVSAEFNATNQELYTSGWKSQFISGLMFPIMHFISNLGYVATAILGGYLAINKVIGIGDIAAFIQYVSQFNQPVTQISQVMTILQSAVAASERVFDFLEEPEEPDPNGTHQFDSKTLKGAVIFDRVNFSYDGKTPTITDFSAKIKPGMKVAIVGPTGAGKTTMVNLLMRFYDPTSGHIEIDGADTETASRANVRKLFGMVLQDTWTFDGTIEENLRYGRLDATKQDIKQAAKSAHIDHMIESLPSGYNTRIDEDSEALSAGEKQLLTIARAFVADPPMMILDEATSSVDTRTEVLIQKALEKLTNGRTSFIIAHRLSTIRSADLILVMKEGNIVEQGTHTQLIKQNGFYADLYNSQFAED
jgi:ATP-binding cassette subfamily B protein